jgi:hypothetical protein
MVLNLINDFLLLKYEVQTYNIRAPPIIYEIVRNSKFQYTRASAAYDNKVPDASNAVNAVISIVLRECSDKEPWIAKTTTMIVNTVR